MKRSPARGNPRRHRRWPGDWNLWRVDGRDNQTHEAVACGFLVTRSNASKPQSRTPELVAYVPGVTNRSLRASLAIDRDNTKAGVLRATKVHDLRPVSGKKVFPRQLVNMLLIPIDRRGRRIASREFIGGMFQRMLTMGEERADGWSDIDPMVTFYLLTHGYFSLLKKKSGTPSNHITHAPGSKASVATSGKRAA